MKTAPSIKPNHPAIGAYYAALAAYATHGAAHEGATETAFGRLLADTARSVGWTLIPKQALKAGGKTIFPDGTLRDAYNLPRGYWEAKDTADDLDAEVRKKIERKYPLVNTVFEDTRRAVLFQNGAEARRFDLADPRQLADLLNQFYAFAEPDIDGFEQAIAEFQERVPELAQGLGEKIAQAHADNPKFQAAFGDFFALCQTALNPNIRREAVDEMLVQHLLTERLFRRIFHDEEFTRRNVVAAEVEKVIAALVSRSFSRDDFLKSLDRFYKAIERAAETIEDFSDKQHFLNTVYERFFQGYSVKVADTHGIVYTPQAIVDFMCASVEEVLRQEFGLTLGSPGVTVLDPCTGTGNFVVNLLRRVPKRELPRVYREQLFANEVMLLPYYIAALNIEHAYYEQTDSYEPFEGLCFVDTLDLAEEQQKGFEFFTEKNAERVERQKRTPITVVIGNPPYNVGQINENDNNKNRKYSVIDKRVKVTYARDSRATSVSKLNDPYVKFFRWATDRLEGRDGIVCFVSNNSFARKKAFDGMRKHLFGDFTRIYHIDLEGDVKENPTLAGTQYNVFGIQVGVGITVALRSARHKDRRLLYARVDKHLRRADKLKWLADQGSVAQVRWEELRPDADHTWLAAEHAEEFASFLPIGSKEAKAAKTPNPEAVFKAYSLGVATHRDAVVCDFNRRTLSDRVRRFIEEYNAEVDRYKRAGGNADVDSFVRYDRVVWDRDLKRDLQRGHYAEFAESKLRNMLYRPFCKQNLFLDRMLNAEVYSIPRIFPSDVTEQENRLICVPGPGNRKPFGCFISAQIIPLDLAFEKVQGFPFYVYDEDGSNRRENVTDWVLKQFRTRYKSRKLSKWDIFHYVYGLLHHPGYRARFADSLKRELPRIPFAPDFQAFAAAGQQLADLHLNYEGMEPYPLKFLETPDVPLSYTVSDKMKLGPDKTSLRVNASLTLAGIPPEVFGYRLGNRSALDWVIDQYHVSEDARSGIRSDPNRAADPEYIVRLVGQVVRVSLETQRIVAGLPESFTT